MALQKSEWASIKSAAYNHKYGNRCVPSQRGPTERPDVANGRLMHNSVLQVKSATETRAELAAREQRRKQMFENMQAVQGGIPSFTRGGGASVQDSADYKALAGLEVGQVVNKMFGDAEAAKKAQARINLYARNGAGTFKTALRGNVLFIVRTSTEYKAQRQRNTESVL